MTWLLLPFSILCAPFLVRAAQGIRLWQLNRRQRKRDSAAYWAAKREARRLRGESVD